MRSRKPFEDGKIKMADDILEKSITVFRTEGTRLRWVARGLEKCSVGEDG